MPPSLFPGDYAFDEPINQWAGAYGLPVSLVKGVVALESNFDPSSYRAEPQIGDGSRGLMQILYRTAAAEGFQGAADDLFDPSTSLEWGCKFLAGLINQPGYSITDAIAAYNMGSPRPASQTTPRIISLYGQPRPDWIYANEPYVRRVCAYTAFYQAVAEGKDDVAAQLHDELKKKRTAAFPLPMFTWTRASSMPGRPPLISLIFDFPQILSKAEQTPLPPPKAGH